MFPTFTGTSRRPRQVNLSGRNNNPFAAVQSTPHGAHNPTSAVAQAQQERRARQQDRERLQAAKVIQRTWKGHSGKEHVKRQLRTDWDKSVRRLGLDGPTESWQKPTSREDALGLLRCLCQFASPQDAGDQQRVILFSRIYLRLVPPPSHSLAGWLRPVQRLSTTVLLMASRLSPPHKDHGSIALLADFTQLLLAFVHHFTSQSITSYNLYYSVLAQLLPSPSIREHHRLKENLGQLVCLPLLTQPRPAETACRSFCYHILTLESPRRLLDFPPTPGINLADMMLNIVLEEPKTKKDLSESFFGKRKVGLLLGYLNNLIQEFRSPALKSKDALDLGTGDRDGPSSSSGAHSPLRDGPETFKFMRAVAKILNHVAGELQEGLYRTPDSRLVPVPAATMANIEQLIDGQDMGKVFKHLTKTSIPSPEDSTSITHAADFASFVLALLRWLPQRQNDIRQWLYTTTITMPDQHVKMSTVKYFWLAFAGTRLFRQISRSSTSAVEMMRFYRDAQAGSQETTLRAGEWKIALLFFELYSFALKILDDHEFMHGADATASTGSFHEHSALRLQEVQSVIVALKNLAFAIYFRSSDILGSTDVPTQNPSLAQLFGNTAQGSAQASDKEHMDPVNDLIVPGIPWANIPFVKNLVTGILRALYDRDSRRKFLPKGHWLMPELDMQGFISVAVSEQRYRMDFGDDLYLEDDSSDGEEVTEEAHLVGTGRSQQHIRGARTRREMERAARKRTLRSVTPRLEIMENLPFFIPFETRVKIFREFVTMDQIQRRGGSTDPDLWRWGMETGSLTHSRAFGGAVSGDTLARHSATVRRGHVFDDALEQFYELGDGLKEPIRITFVDQFGGEEAGVDGGGVTKEFLTNITREAFTPEDSSNDLFVANTQHLLYPNPGIVDGVKSSLQEAGHREGSAAWNQTLRDLYRRFEFLGRVVGKCLYEGILVDIHFAPFFLVKWALTGGSGFASNESNYQSSINDLRDLDEDLYQGLVRMITRFVESH